MSSGEDERLNQQMNFLCEIDALKRIVRQNKILDGSRRENSAEHSWHLALFALILAEYGDGIDPVRVMTMLLVHDIVEIDAGDTFIYDRKGLKDKKIREQKAANRLFKLLPSDQAIFLRTAWDEFEERSTPEARFANSIDRLQPLLHNERTGGYAWRRHGITAEQVYGINGHMSEGAPRLWQLACTLIKKAVARGDLAP